MVWIFGYGSLVWKVGFPYITKCEGFVKGYKRRFWWWSEDHRGTPENPGRVVNLLESEDPSERVWGIAYEVDDDLWEGQIKAQLDYREKGGYSKHTTLFHPVSPNGEPKTVTLYLGCVTHRQYAGPDNLEKMAQTIHQCIGPSGENKEYLYNLASTMRSMKIQDEHLYDLEAAVKLLDGNK